MEHIDTQDGHELVFPVSAKKIQQLLLLLVQVIIIIINNNTYVITNIITVGVTISIYF
jgi:hypothetical protein